MDWSKVDAGLAVSLAEDADPGRRFVVFVHLDPQARGTLAAAGIDAGGEGSVQTATVSALQVAALSDRSEVRRLELSHLVRLADLASGPDPERPVG